MLNALALTECGRMLGRIFSENKLTCCELAVGCVPVLTPLLLISQVDVAAVPPRRVHSFDMDVQGVQLVESVKQIYGTYTIYALHRLSPTVGGLPPHFR